MNGEHPFLDLAAPYALGALDPDETAAFEAHLAGCAACRAEVESFRDVVGLVGFAARPAEPPLALRDRILRDAHKVRPIRSAGHRSEAPEPAPGDSVGEALEPGPVEYTRPGAGRLEPPPPAEDVLVPLSGRSATRRAWLASAAAVVLLLAASALYLREAGARRDAERRVAAAEARARDAERRLAQRDEILATLLSPRLRTATLAAAGEAPSMRLYWDRERNRVVVAAFRLPPAPSGRTYQLWGLAANRPPVSLGTFNTAADGRATLALAVPAGLELSAGAVTREPAGGSAQPTSTPFLIGSWQGE